MWSTGSPWRCSRHGGHHHELRDHHGRDVRFIHGWHHRPHDTAWFAWPWRILDTFVVRPILVPAYLLLIHKYRPRAAEVPARACGGTEPEPGL